jgi:hypothetical protein
VAGELRWTKALRSVGTNACVELAADDDRVALRNSRDPDVVLRFTRDEMRAFLDGAAHHEFDHLVD